MAGRYLFDGGQQERGTCYVCGEDVPVDGEHLDGVVRRD